MMIMIPIQSKKQSLSRVKDNDTPSASNPIISISGPHYVAEGTTFNFEVNATDAPSEEISVNLNVLSPQV